MSPECLAFSVFPKLEDSFTVSSVCAFRAFWCDSSAPEHQNSCDRGGCSLSGSCSGCDKPLWTGKHSSVAQGRLGPPNIHCSVGGGAYEAMSAQPGLPVEAARGLRPPRSLSYCTWLVLWAPDHFPSFFLPSILFFLLLWEGSCQELLHLVVAS